jgi:hypothetical protein
MRWGAAVAAAAGPVACNTVETTPAPRGGVAEMQAVEPRNFVFAPPAASHVIWTERRTFDVSIARTEHSEHDESELRWHVSTHPSLYDTTVVDQRPLYVTASHDGRGIVDGAPALADVQLVVSAGGNLEDVRGLDGASLALRSLAAPGMELRAAQLLSPEALRTIMVTRHDLFVGDVVGRPAHTGATWIVPRKPAGAALLRRYTVEGPRQCGERMCSSVRLHVDLDPHALNAAVIAAVARYGEMQGAPSTPQVAGAIYSMDGEIFIDPRTMRTVGATLADTGRARVTVAGGSFDVDVRGVTQDTFSDESLSAPVGLDGVTPGANAQSAAGRRMRNAAPPRSPVSTATEPW